ncbi:hypothetical protein [Ureaplasma canigenitalium]|uniref:hypothetical protein n=1 Tax=Ureaplasma canigenitalium TaxID=42092 RepID=UPI0004E0BE51|nr:hypothetical protein [Ureaplasma canigenitalium]
MEFLISIKKIDKVMKIINLVTANAGSNLIASCVSIEVVNNMIYFQAQSNINSVKVEVTDEIECTTEGKVLVNAKLLTNLISRLNEPNILFKLIDNQILFIKTKKFETNINVIDFDRMPISSFNVMTNNEVDISYEMLNKIINQVVPNCLTTSLTEKLQVISGVLIDSTREKDKVFLVATDRWKASSVVYPYSGKDCKIILLSQNIKLINDLLKIFPKENLPIKFYMQNNDLFCCYDNIVFILKTIKGEFPDAISIFNDTETYTDVKINRRFLFDALERGKVYVEQENKPKMVVEIKNNIATLSFDTMEVGSLTETVELENTIFCDSIKFIINPNFLSHCIKLFTNDILTFRIQNGKNRPIKIFDEKDSTFQQIISLIAGE